MSAGRLESTMRKFFTFIVLAGTVLTGCFEPQEAKLVEEKAQEFRAPAPTAMQTIENVQSEIEKNCGKDLGELKLEGLQDLEIAPEDQEKADLALQMIGVMAQQCGNFDGPTGTEAAKALAECNPDCSWCPIKWYWCIENAGACAGGDHQSCCKLGACGSKHHCESVCQASCGCDVPPGPPPTPPAE